VNVMPKFPEAFVTLRTCYRHPAGEIGVALANALAERGCVERVAEPRWSLGGYRLTATGKEELIALGLDVQVITPQMVHKACSDYTQRLADGTRGVPHIAGKLGAAMTQWLLSSGAVQRLPQPVGIYQGRTLVLTPRGAASLSAIGLSVGALTDLLADSLKP
jgi:hypothetical protein